MSHTIQTAIAFPIVLTGIVWLLSSGPILYSETAEAASFQAEAVGQELENCRIYSIEPLNIDQHSFEVICTSPERMYSFILALEDSAAILKEGVFSA